MDIQWRDEFFYRMGREEFRRRGDGIVEAHIGPETLRGIIAAAGKVQRANEGECSIPEQAEGQWQRLREQGQRRIAKLLAGTGWTAAYQGDPRGAAVRLLPPGLVEVDHETRGIPVPANGFPARVFERV